jgi:hypothetical protein
MSTHARGPRGAVVSTMAFALAMSCPFGAAALATEGDPDDAKHGANAAEAARSDDVELPAEVRELLNEAAVGAPPSERPDEIHPAAAGTAATLIPFETAVSRPPAPRVLGGAGLSTSSPPDPFVATSVGALITGGALAALGGALLAIDDRERVCGGLAGCVDVRSRSYLGREGAGFSLIGAGVGASVTGGLSLLLSLSLGPEPGDARASAGQGAIGIGLLAGGSALLGAGIGAGVAGDSRVSSDVVPALVTAGLSSGGLGTILLLTRSSDDEPMQQGASSLVPAISVGLGSAEAAWSF